MIVLAALGALVVLGLAVIGLVQLILRIFGED